MTENSDFFHNNEFSNENLKQKLNLSSIFLIVSLFSDIQGENLRIKNSSQSSNPIIWEFFQRNAFF